MKKQYLLGSFIISALLVPVLASAATSDEIRAQIQSLLSQITALRAQLTNLTADDTSVTTTANVSCPNLYRALSRGSRGSDVISLQQFLIAKGYLSSDSATGFFGAMTEAAVRQWQAQNLIVASGDANTTGYGVVGMRTRAAIAARCAGTKPVTTQTCPQIMPPQCTNGTLVSNGTDSNGCSLGYQCKAGSVCPIYNACPTGYTTNTSIDTNGCTKISCTPVSRPSGSFTASPTTGTAPLLVTFAIPDTCVPGLASETVRRIDFGDDKTESVSACGAQSVTHSYQNAGSYTALLQSAGYGPAPLTWETQNRLTISVSGEVSSSPRLQLLQPAGGEEIVSGSRMTVRWSTSGLPNDIASRHPKISFMLSDFDAKGNYGTYTSSNKQANGVAFGNEIADVNTVLSGSATIPVMLHYTSPNKFARGFLQATLSYDRQVAQAASSILATSPMSAYVELYDTTKSEITISFPAGSSGNPCFDDYQSWNLGGTWFADGERRSSTCLVGGPGSGTVDWICRRPNICMNGQWQSGQ